MFAVDGIFLPKLRASSRIVRARCLSSAAGSSTNATGSSSHRPHLKAVLKSEEALQKSEIASGKTEAAFLRRVHGGACRVLRTVLGPEANESHRDHLHLDMKARESRICL